MGYRDDYEALILQLDSLKAELAKQKHGDTDVQARLQELARDVGRATDAVDEDRRALTSIAAKINELQSDLGIAPASADELPSMEEPAASPNAKPAAGTLGCIVFFAIIIFIVGLTFFSVRSGSEETRALEEQEFRLSLDEELRKIRGGLSLEDHFTITSDVYRAIEPCGVHVRSSTTVRLAFDISTRGAASNIEVGGDSAQLRECLRDVIENMVFPEQEESRRYTNQSALLHPRIPRQNADADTQIDENS